MDAPECPYSLLAGLFCAFGAAAGGPDPGRGGEMRDGAHLDCWARDHPACFGTACGAGDPGGGVHHQGAAEVIHGGP